MWGGGDADTLLGGEGNDELHGGQQDDLLFGDGGHDKLFGDQGADTMWGGWGHDTLFGGDGSDVIDGGAGNDTINGGTEDDTMYGGTGDDNYMVEQWGDRVFDEPGAAGGLDKIYTTLALHDMRQWGKGQLVEDLQYVGKHHFTGHGNELKNAVVGAAGWDTLHGHGGDDHLVGGGGRDTLYGGADNDWLNGEGDADWLHGGTGHDTYKVGAGDQVFENAASGVDTVETTLTSYWLGANVENLTFEDETLNFGPWKLFVPTAHNGFGNELNNVMRGASGVDTLFGLAGDDHFDGGGGNDLIFGGANTDAAFYGGRASNYIITAAGAAGTNSFTIKEKATGQIDQLFDVEFARFSDTGFALTWTDFAARKTIDGNGSWGGTVAGTAAAIDTLSYAGADYPVFVDLMRDGGYAQALSSGQGAKVSSIENITGSLNGRNYLHGDAGNNTLTGGNLADWFTGRGGNNLLTGGANGGELYGDLADYLEMTAAVTIDLVAGKAFHSTGTDTLIGIESFRATNQADRFIGDGADNAFQGMNGNDNVAGNAGRDYLIGGNGNDRLDGGIGDDRLEGELDSDTLIGGLNNDWLAGGGGNDAFVFRKGDGKDIVSDFGDVAGNQDVIRIEGAGFASFAALANAGALKQVGADIVVSLDAQTQVTLQNMKIGQLDAGDFLFV